MTHAMPVHGPACSEMYSGRPYFGPPVTDQATPQDWPSVASLVHRFGERRPGLPNSVVLPWYSQFVGQDKRIAGQTGGRMGEEFNPFLVPGNPLEKTFGVDGLALDRHEYDAPRFRARTELRRRLALDSSIDGAMAALLGDQFEQATRMIDSGTAAEAFQLHKETDAARERYGLTKFGQSLLAARRLVEAGVSLLTVNWDDDSRFDKVSPHWDTHHHNFSKLKEGLCPPFDRAFFRVSRRSLRTRPARHHAGRRHGGVWSLPEDRPDHAERDDAENGPRSLAARVHGAVGGRGCRRWPCVWRDDRHRRVRGRCSGHTGRSLGHDPVVPGNQPGPRIRRPISKDAAVAQRGTRDRRLGVTAWNRASESLRRTPTSSVHFPFGRKRRHTRFCGASCVAVWRE